MAHPLTRDESPPTIGVTNGQEMTPQVVGHYRILEKIGSGGMGEVFRARDERLGRDVALKFVHPSCATDPDRLRRFDKEARAAAALNHPNIVAIYDSGIHEDAPYIVSELLEGQTLRARLTTGPLSTRQAAEFGWQISQALVAAHEKLIIHRDLKPENIFITRDERIKILDFGIAKLLPDREGKDHSMGTMETQTRMGSLLGTVAYMAPEQLRAKAVDGRSDLFSVGAILYEMLTGKRAFSGETDVDTITAVLREDPPEMTAERGSIPPAFDQIVHHCLEKDPERRFQSARDLSFALATLAGAATTQEIVSPWLGVRVSRIGLGILGSCLLAAAVWFAAAKFHRPAENPQYERVTFQRGTVFAARFAPDGRIVYEAAWNNREPRLFTTLANPAQTNTLDIAGAHLLAISSSNELALQVNGRHGAFLNYVGGTLAQAPVAGGSPRELLDNVTSADWSPSGELAVIHEVKGHSQLEYPIGKVLYHSSGWISHLRFSPSGDRLAFIEHPAVWDDRGFVVLADLSGNVTRLTQEYASAYGLAWHPSGEVWYTAVLAGTQRRLMAVTPSHKVREVMTDAIALNLQDIGPDGRVLLTSEDPRVIMEFLGPGDREPRDLSWYGASVIKDISRDGQWILFEEFSEPFGADYAVAARKVDGSPPIHLGSGSPGGLSPDGKWALDISVGSDPKVTLVPIGPGPARDIPILGLEHVQNGSAHFLPDGDHIVLNGNEPGHGVRGFRLDLTGGKPVPITPEGMEIQIPSPDGRWILGRKPDAPLVLVSLADGEIRPMSGLEPQDNVAGWTTNSDGLYLYRIDRRPLQIDRVDIRTGTRTLARNVIPSEKMGVISISPVVMTADASEIAFSYYQNITSLYIVRGLR
jgi:eukaryotic-like serine/threonine-protein kinase